METCVREGNPFFSIVMPAYGVERYIKKAMESVQNQTYTDWEIIVVDDCSPDKSGQIAEEFAAKDKRIRVVRHQENRGLSQARNTGIWEAEGCYIWFMDPDDYVEENVLEKVKESLEKNPAEVVMFGLIEEYYGKNGNLEYTHEIRPEEHLYQEKTELRKEVIRLEQQTLYGYAWNKIYSLAYIKKKGFQYENIKLTEDILFNVNVFMDIERLNILSIAPYHYAKRMSANLTNKFVKEYFQVHRQRIELIYKQYQYWELCTKTVRKILGSLYGRYILSAMERNCDQRSGMKLRQRRLWCRRVFREELYQELIPYAEAEDSKMLKIALVLLRTGNITLCLGFGRCIYIVRKYFPMVYSKVKSGR